MNHETMLDKKIPYTGTVWLVVHRKKVRPQGDTEYEAAKIYSIPIRNLPL